MSKQIRVWLAFMLTMIGMGSIMPIYPLLAYSIGNYVSVIGIMWAAWAFAFIAAGPFWGRISDLFGRRNTLLVSSVFMATVFASYSLVEEPLGFYLVGALDGFSQGAIWTIGPALVTDWFASRDRARGMSSLLGSQFLGMGTGPILGGFLAYTFNIDAPFYAASIIVLIGTLAFTRTPASISHPDTEKKDDKKIPLKEAARLLANRPDFLAVCGVASIYGSALGILETQVPIMATRIGQSTFFVGGLITSLYLGVAVIQVPLRKIGYSISPKRLVYLGQIMTILAFLVIGFVDTPSAMLLSVLGVGLMFGILDSRVLLMAADTTPPQSRGFSIGVYMAVYGLGIGIGPLIAGFITDSYGFATTFVLCSASLAASLLLARFRISGRISLPAAALEKQLG